MRPSSACAPMFLCLTLSGCNSLAEDGATLAARAHFEKTTESQNVVFLTQQAPFAGGPAAAAVYLMPSENARVHVGGRAVLISHAAHRDLLARLPKPAPKGAMFFVVEARVRLESDSGRVTTDPPSTRSFLGVVFEEIKRVQWYVPPESNQ